MIEQKLMKNSSGHQGKYRVPYQQCKIHSQKLNYICLDSQCHQNSLICSICRQQAKHEKHIIRPLKFYMQELQQKYLKYPKEGGLHTMLQEIEVKQYEFYEKLKKSIQDIAQQFRKLQQEVNERFSEIKSEIHEEISKRNRFNEFHESLKKGDVDMSNFLIQNYLPQASVGSISNIENLSTLSEEICERISEVKSSIFSRQSADGIKFQKKQKKESGFNVLDMNTSLKRPGNIIFDGAVLTQNQTLVGSKSVCLIDFPIVNLSGKLMFKLLQFKKGSIFTVGVIPKKVYEQMKELWSPEKLDNRSYVLGSDGFAKGWQKRQINQFGQGSSLELCYRAGQLKLSQKSKSCTVKMPNDPDLFVFLVLCGETQVRVTHMK